MSNSVYSGAGNTFVIRPEPVTAEEASKLAQEFDVDGVIFPENTFFMRIFNRDGSEAEMCGNGLRCFVKFLREQGVIQERYTIETVAGTHTAWPMGDNICAELPPPSPIETIAENLYAINTGVPHLVTFVKDVDTIDLEEIGPALRHHPHFENGCNVNIVQLNPFKIRTYERGVERETQACGTGATACALVAAHVHALPSPISVGVASGDLLKIGFDSGKVTMEGPAEQIVLI